MAELWRISRRLQFRIWCLQNPCFKLNALRQIVAAGLPKSSFYKMFAFCAHEVLQNLLYVSRNQYKISVICSLVNFDCEKHHWCFRVFKRVYSLVSMNPNWITQKCAGKGVVRRPLPLRAWTWKFSFTDRHWGWRVDPSVWPAWNDSHWNGIVHILFWKKKFQVSPSAGKVMVTFRLQKGWFWWT